MFRRLLVANRGEVAVRVARAARELGISPLAVSSQADLGSPWLDAFDEVVCVGPGAPRESYLARERVLQAALQTGAAALHPGWGFLAEDPIFAALCEQHGVTFVGPPAHVMQRMALKSPAKRAMRELGLEVIPGSGVLAELDGALAAAREIGYPVLCKADAGGGGRGMRLCASETDLKKAWPEAQAEALAAFGDGRLYLEKYLEGGRHVEFQVLVDGFGHAVHLGERECSVQRNHQKLLEESPSPALTPEERERHGRAAAAAAAGIGYVGAGTIEFLRHADGTLYFMEMNTRLQVEHPVSEMTSGVDIVAWQLRIAAHEALALEQDEIELRGASIECRINAEDPAAGFRPAPGTLGSFEIPRDLGPGRVRVDTHLASGARVPPHYDSLLAKVIVHAPDRPAAIETMKRALAGARIEGLPTTLPLHRAVLADPGFVRGEYDTRAIPGWPPRAS